jgi:iron complex transport system substrate-binding protein
MYRLINYLSIYEMDLNLISKLNPNVIITQSQCNICAIDFDEVKKSIRSITGFTEKIKLITLEAKDLQNIFEDIQRIADALETPSKGISLITNMKNEIFNLNSKIPPPFQPTKNCLYRMD